VILFFSLLSGKNPRSAHARRACADGKLMGA